MLKFYVINLFKLFFLFVFQTQLLNLKNKHLNFLFYFFSRKWPFGENLEWLCQLAHSCQGTPVFLSSMAIVAIGEY
jgi:hypothetical protein